MSRSIPKRHTHAAGDIQSGQFRLTLLGTGTPIAGQVLRGDGTWGAITPAMLGTGTPSGSTFLRGDGTWAVPAGGGGGGGGNTYFPGGWA